MNKEMGYCAIHDRQYLPAMGCEDCREGPGYSPGKEALIEAQMEGRPLQDVASAPAFCGALHVAPPPRPSVANQRQHGGDHYRHREYQHWDFVCDTGLHYLLGCATKYVSRWRKKNGREDLEKALHYVEKAAERGVFPPVGATMQVERFVMQLDNSDANVIRRMMEGNYEGATLGIRWLLHEAG